jgi:hypothetical protein
MQFNITINNALLNIKVIRNIIFYSKVNEIIIFEGHIKSNLEKVNECFEYLKKMDYIVYIIDEDAGNPGDARNFISIPKQRHEYFKQNFDFFNYIIILEYNSFII